MPADCTHVRAWVSAYRDGEALPDPQAREHLDACQACTAWAESLDALTRRMAVRAAGSPDLTGPALRAWAAQVTEPGTAQQRVARAILGVAGAAGLILAVATAFGVVDPAAGHSVRDLVAMESALAVGFLLGSWRPDRYTRGLLPVAAVAGVLTLTMSAGDVAGSSADLLREASHLPVLLGLLGLFVLLDGTGATVPRRRR